MENIGKQKLSSKDQAEYADPLSLNFKTEDNSETKSLLGSLRRNGESCCLPTTESKKGKKAHPTTFDNTKAEHNLVFDKASNIRQTFLKMNPDLGVSSNL